VAVKVRGVENGQSQWRRTDEPRAENEQEGGNRAQ